MNFQRYFDRPLGSDSLPFGHKRKMIAPLIAAIAPAVIGAATKVAGGLLNNSATKSTNQTNKEIADSTNQMNLQIARETNDMSESQFQRNMDWLQEQFYKEREYALDERDYQSAAKQVERLRAAGLNPAFFFGQGNVSTPAVSSVGAPSPSNFHAAHMEAYQQSPLSYDFIADAAGQAINTFFDSAQKTHQMRMNDLEYQKAAFENGKMADRYAGEMREQSARIDGILANKDLSQAQRDYYLSQKEDLDNKIRFFNDSYEENLRGVKLSNDQTEANIGKLNAESNKLVAEEALLKVEAHVKTILAQNQIRLSNAQIEAIHDGMRKTNFEIQNLISEGVLLDRKSTAQKIENDLNSIILRDKQFKEYVNNQSFTKSFRTIAELWTDVLLKGVRLGK